MAQLLGLVPVGIDAPKELVVCYICQLKIPDEVWS